MPSTDDAILDMVENEVLGTQFIEELLALVDKGDGTIRSHGTSD